MDHDDVVRVQGCGVDVQPSLESAAGRPVERHVCPIEWQSPGREAVHHRGGHVAGHGTCAELGKRCLQEQGVARDGVVGCPLPLHIGAAPDRHQDSRSQQAAHVVLVVAGRAQSRGTMQYRFHAVERAALRPCSDRAAARACGQPTDGPADVDNRQACAATGRLTHKTPGRHQGR